MKKTLIAAAALASLAGVAQAQSVTLYGRVDVGFEYVSDTTTNGLQIAGSPTDSVSKLQNGGILPSIWGMRGSEDLGNGLKAVFNLESDFGGDTGGSRGLGNISTLFGRQANVGLSGSFGTVLLGRQYSPAILADLGTDPRGYKESFSSLLTYALSQNPAGNSLGEGNNGAGIFTSNMISYTGAFGPVTLRAGYGLGEVAGKGSDRSTIALGLTYSGPITVSASYKLIKSTTTTVTVTPDNPNTPANELVTATGDMAETKRFSLGASVPLGNSLTFKAYYAVATGDRVDGVEIQDLQTLGLGVNWAWNPANTLTVAYYRGDDDKANGKTNDIVISNDYALSKRTTLYVQYVHADVDAGANVVGSIAVDRGIVAGEKTSIFGVGLKHDF